MQELNQHLYFVDNAHTLNGAFQGTQEEPYQFRTSNRAFLTAYQQPHLFRFRNRFKPVNNIKDLYRLIVLPQRSQEFIVGSAKPIYSPDGPHERSKQIGLAATAKWGTHETYPFHQALIPIHEKISILRFVDVFLVFKYSHYQSLKVVNKSSRQDYD